MYTVAFTICSTLIVPFWLLMILAPKHAFTSKLMKSIWVVVPFMLAYAVLEIPYIATSVPLFIKPNFSAITQLFRVENHVALAWIHFIAADLFVGRWVFLDSRERNMNIWAMAPILFFTAMLCPFGFILYMIYRTARGGAHVGTE